MILNENGAPPIICVSIRVHSISYIKPQQPERKKQVSTRKYIPGEGLSKNPFLAIAIVFKRESFPRSVLFSTGLNFNICAGVDRSVETQKNSNYGQQNNEGGVGCQRGFIDRMNTLPSGLNPKSHLMFIDL
jgi:hypothetical protein